MYNTPVNIETYTFLTIGFRNIALRLSLRSISILTLVPVEIFSLPNRRGKFALSRDVAEWLATVKQEYDKGGG